MRRLHRSGAGQVTLPPLNIGALFQRFLGVIFEKMDANRDGSVNRKEAIEAVVRFRLAFSLCCGVCFATDLCMSIVDESAQQRGAADAAWATEQ